MPNRLLFFSTLLALQFGLQPFLTKHFISPHISKASIVITTDIAKVFISVISFSFESNEIKKQIFSSWNIKDCLRLSAIPAILFVIQNFLIQYGYSHLDSMTFNLLNQTKTIAAAFFLWVLLGKTQSLIQITALLLLLFAALLLSLDTESILSFLSSTRSQSYSNLNSTSFQSGLIMVGMASLLSGLTATLTQMAMTSSTSPRNSLLMSSEMAIVGLLFLLSKELLQAFLSPSSSFINLLSVPSTSSGLWRGWDIWTLLPCLINAGGGVVVGQITKYGGGVAKGFAVIAGLVVTAVAQWVLDGKALRGADWVAVLLVILSVYLHTNFPPHDISTPKPEKIDNKLDLETKKFK